jgi:hypothetical protein
MNSLDQQMESLIKERNAFECKLIDIKFARSKIALDKRPFKNLVINLRNLLRVIDEG